MEIWKDIPGYDGYKVSNLGNVKSYLTDVNGKILNKRYDKDGYEMVNTKYNSASRVHKLVLLAFKNEEYFESAVVNHLNGIKNDNRLINLEWTTVSKNTKHAYDIGLAKSAMSKLIGVFHEGNLISAFESINKLSKHLGIDRNTLSLYCDTDSLIFDELTIKSLNDVNESMLNRKIVYNKLSRYQSQPLVYKGVKFESIKSLSEYLKLKRSIVVYKLDTNSPIHGGIIQRISRYEFIKQNDFND